MIVFGTKLARVLDVLGEEAHKFSSTQIDIKGDLAEELLGFGKQIDSDDLAGDGLEDRPHITLKYGLHTGDAEDVREVLEGVPGFEVTLQDVSAFPPSKPKDGEDQYEVLKIDVESP